MSPSPRVLLGHVPSSPIGSSSSLLVVVVSGCAPASPVTVQPRARNRFHFRVGFSAVRPLQTAASKTISTMGDPVIRTASPYTNPNIKCPRLQRLSSGPSSSFINNNNNNSNSNNKSSNSKYPNCQPSSLDNAHAYTSTYTLHAMPLMTKCRHIFVSISLCKAHAVPTAQETLTSSPWLTALVSSSVQPRSRQQDQPPPWWCQVSKSPWQPDSLPGQRC